MALQVLAMTALSEAADTLLDYSIEMMLGAKKHTLTAADIAVISEKIEQTHIGEHKEQLAGLVANVNKYRRNPGGSNLERLSEAATNISVALTSHSDRPATCRSYQLAVANEIYLLKEQAARAAPEFQQGARENVADAGARAAGTILRYEDTISEKVSFGGFAAFKHYTLEGGRVDEIRAMQREPDRSSNPDVAKWIGDKYRENVLKYIEIRGGLEGLPRALYVCRLLPPAGVGWDYRWIRTIDPLLVYVCEPSDGYFPVGDAAFDPEGDADRRVLHVKPLAGRMAPGDRWSLIWDDGDADKSDKHPADRRGFYRFDHSNLTHHRAIGDALGSVSDRGRGIPDRIAVFPVEDLDHLVEQEAVIRFTDRGSGHKDDLYIYNVLPQEVAEGLFHCSTDDTATFVSNPPPGTRPFLALGRQDYYFLKTSTLKGY